MSLSIFLIIFKQSLSNRPFRLQEGEVCKTSSRSMELYTIDRTVKNSMYLHYLIKLLKKEESEKDIFIKHNIIKRLSDCRILPNSSFLILKTEKTIISCNHHSLILPTTMDFNRTKTTKIQQDNIFIC